MCGAGTHTDDVLPVLGVPSRIPQRYAARRSQPLLPSSVVLPPETIKYAIETAFRPLRCVVELYDDGTQLRFRLFDPNAKPTLRTLLKMEGQRVSHLSDPQNLNELISLCREHAEELGYRLEPQTPLP